MTHTFDSEVSLHSWLFWPTVRHASFSQKTDVKNQKLYVLPRVVKRGRDQSSIINSALMICFHLLATVATIEHLSPPSSSQLLYSSSLFMY